MTRTELIAAHDHVRRFFDEEFPGQVTTSDPRHSVVCAAVRTGHGSTEGFLRPALTWLEAARCPEYYSYSPAQHSLIETARPERIGALPGRAREVG
jgi:hypothetical protein